MYVIIQSYNETNENRQKELAFCTKQLVSNSQVDMVYDVSELEEPKEWMMEYATHSKYSFHSNNKWISYNAAIKFALDNIPKGSLVALMNNDIFLSPSQNWTDLEGEIKQMMKAHARNVIVALTRMEWGESEETSYLDESFKVTYGFNSQDAWIWFNGTIVPDEEYEIPLGIMGCDNAILHRLFTVGHIIPYNLAHKWRIYHNDKCRSKTSETSVEFHTKGQKQASQRFEERGGLVLPVLSAVPLMMQNMVCMRQFHPAFTVLEKFPLQYELFLRAMMKHIKIKN